MPGTTAACGDAALPDTACGAATSHLRLFILMARCVLWQCGQMLVWAQKAQEVMVRHPVRQRPLFGLCRPLVAHLTALENSIRLVAGAGPFIEMDDLTFDFERGLESHPSSRGGQQVGRRKAANGSQHAASSLAACL